MCLSCVPVPISLEAQAAGFSLRRRGFESRWGHRAAPLASVHLWAPAPERASLPIPS